MISPREIFLLKPGFEPSGFPLAPSAVPVSLTKRLLVAREEGSGLALTSLIQIKNPSLDS